MSHHDSDAALHEGGIPLGLTLSTPDRAALSKTTTIVENDNFTPRTSNSDNIKGTFETDIEALPTNSSAGESHPRRSVILNRPNDCQVWPGKDQWKQRARAAKAKRGWLKPMAGMSRRNKIITKIIIIVLIVGIAVGVGFGVSKPLGAPIWGKPKS